MKQTRTLRNKSGTILVDFIVAGSLVTLVSAAICWVVLHLWVYNFVATESYFLARSRLYGNTQSCESSNLISTAWVNRQQRCIGSTIHTEYEVFPSLRRQREILFKDLPSKESISLTLER